MIPKKIKTDQNTLRRFIRMVVNSHDTPALIRRIAEHYPNMVYCSAFVTTGKSIDPTLSKLRQALKMEVRRQGVSSESINEKLTAVAAVLGLYKHSPESIQLNYYDILGISPDADINAIKKAFRARAFETHPDTAVKQQQTAKNEMFLSIEEAFRVLSDPALKRQYDISRVHKNIGQWFENPVNPDEAEPDHGRKRKFMRIFGYPLIGVILLMAGIALFVDMILQEISLNDGLGEKSARLSAPAHRAINPESPMQERVSENPVAKKDTTNTDQTDTLINNPLQPAEAIVAPNNIKRQPAMVERTLQPRSKSAPAPFGGKKEPVLAKTISEPANPGTNGRTESKPLLVHASPAVSTKKSMDVTGSLTFFLNQYCEAYENRDLEKFMAFFANNAVENNRPLSQLTPIYLKNFQNTREIEYPIDMTDYTLDLSRNKILLNGHFAMQWLKKEGGQRHHSAGNIQMTLNANDDSFLVQKLSYQFNNQ